MTTIKNFSETFNGIKDVMKKENETQKKQLESLKSDLSKEMRSYASVLKSPQTTDIDKSLVLIVTGEIKMQLKMLSVM